MNGDEEQLVQAPYQLLMVGPISVYAKRGSLTAEGQALLMLAKIC